MTSSNYYAPQIFQNLGLTGTSVGLFATGIYGVIKMVMCGLFLIFAADSLGRRKSLLWTSIAMGLSMMYVGLFVRIDPPQEGVPVSGPGYFALVCIYLFASFFQWGWGPVSFPKFHGRRRVDANERVSGLLDLRVGDPDRSSPWPERLPCRRYSVALQPGDCACCPQHVGHHGREWLRCIHRLCLLLFVHVHLCLVPGS